ncbi:MAG: hypothetical protein LBT05_03615, partial [Planctomycetaceae bacterium]|nr:hypothetical protein [Planctomycetaceae bacterium]
MLLTQRRTLWVQSRATLLIDHLPFSIAARRVGFKSSPLKKDLVYFPIFFGDRNVWQGGNEGGELMKSGDQSTKVFVNLCKVRVTPCKNKA